MLSSGLLGAGSSVGPDVWTLCIVDLVSRFLVGHSQALHLVCDPRLLWCSEGQFEFLMWRGREKRSISQVRTAEPHQARDLGSELNDFLIVGVDADFVLRVIQRLQLNAEYARVILSWPDAKSMKMVFRECWRSNIVQVLAVPLSEPVEVFTYFPYVSTEHCLDTSPVLVERWGPSGWELKSPLYYKDKVRDLHGCPLRIVSFPLPPMHFLTSSEEGGLQIVGRLGEWYDSVQKYVNFLPRIQLPSDGKETWGNLKDDSGMYHDLLHEKVNVAFAVSPVIEGEAEVVCTTSFSCVAVCVPAIPLEESPLDILARPMEPSVWFALVLSCGIVVLSFVFIGKLWRRQSSIPFRLAFSFVFSPLIGRGPQKTPSAPSFRFLMATTYCFSIIMSSLYQGAWHSLHTVVLQQYAINSVDDLFQSDLRFVVQKDLAQNVILPRQGTKDPLLNRILSSTTLFESNFMELFKVIASDSSIATVCAAEACNDMNEITRLKYEILVVPDYCFMNSPYGFITMKRGSPFVERFRQIHLRLLENGMEYKFVHHDITSVAKTSVKHIGVKALNFSMIVPAFYIQGLGCVAALLTLLLEILVSRKYIRMANTTCSV